MDPKALLIPLRKQVGVLPENLGFRKKLFRHSHQFRTSELPMIKVSEMHVVPLGTPIIYRKIFDMKT